MLEEKRWLESHKNFRANSKQGAGAILAATIEEVLSLEERQQPLIKLQPPEKRHALLFYAQIRANSKPNVDHDVWIDLGLCTVPDAAPEDQLCVAYRLLIERCTFQEFWSSMRNPNEISTAELFWKYGLEHNVLGARNFLKFMTTPKGWHESVWYLKWFIRTKSTVTDPFRAVVVGYGFMNATDEHQQAQLRILYQKYFDRGEDEMKLHEACVTGKLASFLRTVLGGLLVPPELLGNDYPLENCPYAGMVIPGAVVLTAKPLLNQVQATGREEESGQILAVPDDSLDPGILQKQAAFLGMGLRRRIYSGPDGKRIASYAVM